MKKMFILFVLALSFMSFSSENELNEISLIRTCCTVPITFNGEPAGSITRCVDGEGPTANTISCMMAYNAAQTYVNKKNAEFQSGL